MKAITYTKYGSPDVLKISEIEKPKPKDHEVLVKIHAASVNPLDWHFMRGTPKLMRLTSGLKKPKHPFLGADLSGIVESIGAKVSKFQPGDAVFGDTSLSRLGSLAEYVCTPEDSLVLKPDNLSFEEAAAIPVAGITALQAIKSVKLKAGQSVLINGAAGGVGLFAVQIAKSMGANVTAICSTKNKEMVLSCGADQVIDYTKTDFSKTRQQYDLIIDNVGNRKLSAYFNALNSKGKCVIVGYTSPKLLLQHMLLGPIQSLVRTKKVNLMGAAQTNTTDLNYLKQLCETGKLKPLIDRKFALNETADAIRYLETGHARAKVVILM
jgi:2-desacetyl-2-hydroxyethyl bacteriochlorophyllide A dehydrogenase